VDNAEARVLLASLWDRIERGGQNNKWMLQGAMSGLEREALRKALDSFGVESAREEAATRPAQTNSAKGRPPVKLNDSVLAKAQNSGSDVTMCLDFGTAMSKAFAIRRTNREPVDLALGRAAGYTEAVYPVPSSLFVSSHGRVYFGHQAVSQSLQDSNPERERFDSPKQILSQGSFVDIKNVPVSRNLNPTDVDLTQGDLILTYLAYLTDLAGAELEARGVSRYVPRRFAMPCWDKQRTVWAESLLREMLGQAQILADTFGGRWKDGIDVRDLRSAIDQVKKIDIPQGIVAEGIPEPIAAGSSVIVRPGLHRTAFVVVDVGAGTTDFGLFVATNIQGTESFFQATNSIRGIRQAGDSVDVCLKQLILQQHSVDRDSAYGRRISADLNLKIRQYKEILFSGGKLEYTLADDTRGLLTRDEFLATPLVRRFGAALEDELARTLNAVDRSWIEGLISKQGLTLVLTGGGAHLPMVQSLARGKMHCQGLEFERRSSPLVPEWVENEFPAFRSEYPQLAVAIGGASPELFVIKKEFVKFGGGMTHSTVSIGNLQVTGV
jgi:hypothetical protein